MQVRGAYMVMGTCNASANAYSVQYLFLELILKTTNVRIKT